MWPRPTGPEMLVQVKVPHTWLLAVFAVIAAVPEPSGSHGRWAAHCCAPVIVEFHEYVVAPAADAVASAAAMTAAATPPRSAVRRLGNGCINPPVLGLPHLGNPGPTPERLAQILRLVLNAPGWWKRPVWRGSV